MFRLVPVFWKEQWHIHEAKIGLLMGLNGLIISVLEMVVVNYMETRRLQVKFVLYGTLLTSLSYLFLMVQTGPLLVLAILTVITFTFGEMLTFPYLNTLTSLRATDHNRGQYAAIYSFTWSFAQVIGPAGGAFLVAHSSYNVLWMVLMLLAVLTLAGFRYLLAASKDSSLPGSV
jgi:MFS family permease